MLCLRACLSPAPSHVAWPPEFIAQSVSLVVSAMRVVMQIYVTGVVTETAEFRGSGVFLGIDGSEYFGINEDLNQIGIDQPPL